MAKLCKKLEVRVPVSTYLLQVFNVCILHYGCAIFYNNLYDTNLGSNLSSGDRVSFHLENTFVSRTKITVTDWFEMYQLQLL